MKKFNLLVSAVAVITMVSGCNLKDVATNVFENQPIGQLDLALDKVQTYDNVKAPEIELESIGQMELDFSDIQTYDKVEAPKIELESIGQMELDFSDIPVYDSVKSVEFGDFHVNVDSEDVSKADDLSESELQQIATKQTDLFADLQTEFEKQGISVTINPNSGTVSLDSTVLFGGDSAVLSEEGKTFLKKFVSAYTGVAYSAKYDGFISKVMVEGHIAPVKGTTYEGGMALSQKRADNVLNYCLSQETGLSSSVVAKLRPQLEAVGLSNSNPVKDQSGEVDMAASRRVSFRFLIQID